MLVESTLWVREVGLVNWISSTTCGTNSQCISYSSCAIITLRIRRSSDNSRTGTLNSHLSIRSYRSHIGITATICNSQTMWVSQCIRKRCILICLRNRSSSISQFRVRARRTTTVGNRHRLEETIIRTMDFEYRCTCQTIVFCHYIRSREITYSILGVCSYHIASTICQLQTSVTRATVVNIERDNSTHLHFGKQGNAYF